MIRPAQSPQERIEKREHQCVEHCGLIHTVTVMVLSRNAYAFIEGQRHNVYPTGNDNEPWTTNSTLMMQ